MKIKIVGNGAFGSFLNEILSSTFNIQDNAETIILAVPISAYNEVSKLNRGKHLINVCSVQKPSTDICLKYSDMVTSIHPLFGRRTPANKRNSILTYKFTTDNDTWLSQTDIEHEFLNLFAEVSDVIRLDSKKIPFTTESHDVLMAKTHVSAIMAAKQLKVYTDRVKDIDDKLVPNSFRLMREFVNTLEDMPSGTVESIMANPYI